MAPETLSTTRKRRSRLLLGAVAVSALILTPALAANLTGLESIGLGPSAKAVSDEELGEMRGRFVQPDAIRFFGIQLASYWEMPAEAGGGTVMTAAIQFQVEFDESGTAGTPTLLASFTHGCGGCGDESVEVPVPAFSAEGLKTIDGAVQTTEISGDDNDVANVMRIAIGEGINAGTAGFGTGGTPITQPTTHSFPNDASITFNVEGNSIGLIMQGENGAGMVLQGVNGGTVGQIAQHVQVIGNSHDIHNAIDLMIGIEQAPAAAISVENALNSMKGMGF